MHMKTTFQCFIHKDFWYFVLFPQQPGIGGEGNEKQQEFFCPN